MRSMRSKNLQFLTEQEFFLSDEFNYVFKKNVALWH
jgi:hypothetical protein